MSASQKKHLKANSPTSNKAFRDFIINDPEPKRRVESKEIEEAVRRELNADRLGQKLALEQKFKLRHYHCLDQVNSMALYHMNQ